MYIVSKHKIKSKTPGKLIGSKHQLPEGNIIKKHTSNNLNINTNKINNEYKSGIKISKSNINEKYKQIESKSKNDEKEVAKIHGINPKTLHRWMTKGLKKNQGK